MKILLIGIFLFFVSSCAKEVQKNNSLSILKGYSLFSGTCGAAPTSENRQCSLYPSRLPLKIEAKGSLSESLEIIPDISGYFEVSLQPGIYFVSLVGKNEKFSAKSLKVNIDEKTVEVTFKIRTLVQ